MLRVAGDALYVDAVAAIDRADRRQRAALAQRASRLRRSGSASLTTIALPRPRRTCTAARAEFERREPVRGAGDVELGAVAYVSGRTTTRTTSMTARCRSWPRRSSYRYAAGRATWFLGLLAIGAGPVRRRAGDTKIRSRRSTRMGDVEQAAGAQPAGRPCTSISATTAPNGSIAGRARRARRSRVRRGSSIRCLHRQPAVVRFDEPGNGARRCRTRCWQTRASGAAKPRSPTCWRSALDADRAGPSRRRRTGADRRRSAPRTTFRTSRSRSDFRASGPRGRERPAATPESRRRPPRQRREGHRDRPSTRRSLAASRSSQLRLAQGQHRVGPTRRSRVALDRGYPRLRRRARVR